MTGRLRAEQAGHKGKPKLVRPMDEVVEEIRGVGNDEDPERAEEELLDDAEDGEVEVEEEVGVEYSGQKEKNQRKRENKKAEADKRRLQDEVFEEALGNYEEELRAERSKEETSLSQEATGVICEPVEEGSEWRKPKALTAPMRVTAE